MGLNIQDLEIDSAAFGFGQRMPDAHSHEHDDVSPELRISGVPDGTAELAVICHDPDAPLPYGFTHWTLYGLPADTTVIEQDGGGGYREGPNGFGETGYGGPLPPEGHGDHHYYFWVYALDTTVDGAPGREDFLARYGDNIIEQNRTVGIYSR